MAGFFRRMLALLSLVTALSLTRADEPPLRTVAEKSDYKATSLHSEVLAFCEELARRTPLVRYSQFGKTKEGRDLPLLVISEPAVATPEEAKRSGKPILLVMANIHAGEVDGKEAVLAMARDLTLPRGDALLKHVVLLIVPNFNPDGNDRFSREHRPEQNGPPEVGIRGNGEGRDLNRDFVKLETPEVRALVKLLTAWDPWIVIECHTTNGSYHRYTLTYDGPRNPAADAGLNLYAFEKLLPDIAARIKKSTGFDTFLYGNFSPDRKEWITYPATPRFGVQCFAMRGLLGMLAESYSYAGYRDRIKASYAFVQAHLEHLAEHAREIQKVIVTARENRSTIALRTRTLPRAKKETVLGYEEILKDGKRARTDKPQNYEVTVVDRVEAALTVQIPYAYLIPRECTAAVETLQRHGIQVDEIREQIELDTQAYTVTETKQAEREFQGHRLRSVEVKVANRVTKAEPGMFLVRTSQRLGTLAAYLLEPQAEDGLTTWNYFDPWIKVNETFPVQRLTREQPVFTGKPMALPEDRFSDRPFTMQMLGGVRLGRESLGGVNWLPDGEHFLQVKQGKLWKVAARTGRAELFVDPAVLRKSLEAIKDLPAERLRQFMTVPSYRFDPSGERIVVDLGMGYYLAYRDGRPAVALINDRGYEFPSFSPDGKFIAYVRGGNLYTVEVASGRQRQHTTDGGGDILNGRADWVYFEELFDRNGQAFWWSPDSQRIAFLRFDDKRVPKFSISDTSTPRGRLETVAYPKAGDANPFVQLGVVTVDGPADRKPIFLSLADYKPEDLLIARVGWVPGKVPHIFAYVQNRVQTWLDFLVWPDPAGQPKKLFRDATKAWIEDLGEPRYLSDGSFLILSERSGWKHIYHYEHDGTLIRPVTSGTWEVRTLHRVDEAKKTIYFSGTKVRSTMSHFGRVQLDGSDLKLMTSPEHSHNVDLPPVGSLFIDRWTDDMTPTQTVLRDTRGSVVRVLDTNPVHDRAGYRYGKYERLSIRLQDGFEIEAAITYPPQFDPTKKHPIWIFTYAGPHAPTVHTGWGNGRIREQILAAMGIVVVQADPRSASGKGAESTWTCYKQLGVQELKDLEEVVDWLSTKSWVDSSRVGISGHSYGGFMASYALTHSKKFAAGIAGAPVTDWHLYDSIYTERYMGLPAENKSGYEKSSVVKAAAQLHGKLLLVHGMLDDNVHVQNSLQFVDELQKANKTFDLMVYPRFRHGIVGPHYTRLQMEFIQRTMGVGK